ncbi:MAG: hypothetical protein XXXJIFNMEKO3_00751 [Candidatus Erwinia impunctatus]|nr:hypothetical protein XXXJIFNMEKO_00751 [Culicoides impunctatus]
MDVSLKYIYPLLFCCMTPIVQATTSDADGNPVAASAIRDPSQVLGGYKEVREDGFSSSTDSPYKVRNSYADGSSFYLPEKGETYQLNNIENFYAADGGNHFTINIQQPDKNDNKLLYLEGSYAAQAEVNFSGEGAYGVFYKNYTSGVTVNASDNATVVIDSNYAKGATLNSDNASLYLISDVAQNAIINNKNNSYMKISDSDASEVDLTNDNSEMHILNSSTDGATMKNNNGGTLYVSNNNVSNTHIVNDSSAFYATNNIANNASFENGNQSVFVFNGGNISGSAMTNDNSSSTLSNVHGNDTTVKNLNKGQMSFSNISGNHYLLDNGSGKVNDNSAMTLTGNNSVTLSTVNNLTYASMSLSGYLEFTGSTLNNQSFLQLDNLTLQSGTINNSGITSATKSTLNDFALNNNHNGQVNLSDVNIDRATLNNGSGESNDQSALILQGNNSLTATALVNHKYAKTMLTGALDFIGSTLDNAGSATLQNLALQQGTINNHGNLVAQTSSFNGLALTNQQNGQVQLSDVNVDNAILINGSGEENDQSSLLLQGSNIVKNTTITNQQNAQTLL